MDGGFGAEGRLSSPAGSMGHLQTRKPRPRAGDGPAPGSAELGGLLGALPRGRVGLPGRRLPHSEAAVPSGMNSVFAGLGPSSGAFCDLNSPSGSILFRGPCTPCV